MNLYLLIIVGTLICSVSFGQRQIRDELGNGNFYEPNLYKSNYGSNIGSPYLNEEFLPAKVNDYKNPELVRFNAIEGTVEVLISENKVIVLDNSIPYAITLLDNKKQYFIKKFIDSKENLNSSYFELIDSVNYHKIYLKENKVFQKKVKAQGYADEEPAKFKKSKDEVFISNFNGQTSNLLKLPETTNKFVKVFDPDSKMIKQFIKDEKLDVSQSKDVVKILKFYYKDH